LRYRDDYFVGRCPGIVGVTGFLGCFGFFFSLLLRCCPLAMIVLLRLWWRHYGEERDREEENESAGRRSGFSVARGQENKLEGKSEKRRCTIAFDYPFPIPHSPFTFHPSSYLPGLSI
jgi:hypothetical protein